MRTRVHKSTLARHYGDHADDDPNAVGYFISWKNSREVVEEVIGTKTGHPESHPDNPELVAVSCQIKAINFKERRDGDFVALDITAGLLIVNYKPRKEIEASQELVTHMGGVY